MQELVEQQQEFLKCCCSSRETKFSEIKKTKPPDLPILKSYSVSPKFIAAIAIILADKRD
jgi:hypothetical protein